MCLARTMVRSSDITLTGTSWVVIEIAGRPTSEPRPQLTFGDDGRIGGTTGVNRLGGRYAVAEGVLTVTDAVMTRMAGPPEAMDQEQRLLDVLAEPRPLTSVEGGLALGRADAAHTAADTPSHTAAARLAPVADPSVTVER